MNCQVRRGTGGGGGVGWTEVYAVTSGKKDGDTEDVGDGDGGGGEVGGVIR